LTIRATKSRPLGVAGSETLDDGGGALAEDFAFLLNTVALSHESRVPAFGVIEDAQLFVDDLEVALNRLEPVAELEDRFAKLLLAIEVGDLIRVPQHLLHLVEIFVGDDGVSDRIAQLDAGFDAGQDTADGGVDEPLDGDGGG
jgi:hypothetical protein